jgi:hypothetical protein
VADWFDEFFAKAGEAYAARLDEVVFAIQVEDYVAKEADRG